MAWIPVIVLLAVGAVLAISMLRGGKLGERWYTGGQSRRERDEQGPPVEPTDNERTREW